MLIPSNKASDDAMDAMLRDKMVDIDALIAAIVSEQPDCDLKLAELLEGEPEAMRVAIIKKLRDMLKALAEEKEKELDKHLEAQKRVHVEQQRNRFMQWLTWIMSEETIDKMREAFLANAMMERAVRGVGRQMAQKGMNDIQPSDRRDLGGLSNNAPLAPLRERDKDKGTGRN
jgi:ribosomal 50S subunit-associated protein YjgA (DUF615 family)